MSSSIITAENISKKYLIGRGRDASDGIRHVLESAVRNPIKWLIRQKERAAKGQEEFWALDDVSFEIKQGQVMGIVGRNGAGKSTLLKILSRITKPTSGRVRLNGRVASLLEVGTGFHPELTGRENIFLNGAILGMSKLEIVRKFDEIVAFSEVEKHLDMPVKRYSSGMYVRLAFAVAAHLEPEILIVDEVLAVGDAAFQRKCLGKMEDVSKGQGRTVLFVSHNMGMVTRLCSHSMLLEKGRLTMMGPTETVIPNYLSNDGKVEAERAWTDDEQSPGTNKVRLRSVRATDAEGNSSGTVDIRRPVFIEIQYDVLQALPHLRVGFRLLTAEGTEVFSSADTANADWRQRPRGVGRYVSRCEIPGNLLNEGVYMVTVGGDTPYVEGYFVEEYVIRFEVEQTGGPGSHDPEKWPGVVCPQLGWEVEMSKRHEAVPHILQK
jgi:lipopolysaccharide transport system ATP-binding protein